MTINVQFHNRGDLISKFRTVRYRINDGKFRKDYSTNIKIDPKYWSKKHKEVSELHPHFEDINRQLQELKNKIFEAENKFKNKRFTRQQVINYMEGKADFSSLIAYCDTVLKDKKSDQNYRYFRNSIRAIESQIGYPLTFEELLANGQEIFEDYYNSSKKRVKEKTLSPSSYNSYIKAIGIICNHAYKNKALYERIEVPFEFKSLKKDEIEITSFTTYELKDRIEKIETIYDWKALSLWLLMFSLRGLYQSDIATMREDNVEDGKRNKTARKLTSWWRDNQYIHHKRAKTGIDMLIKLHKTPVLSLMDMVKNVIVFLDYPNPKRKDVVASINNKVEIYNYDPLENTKFHKNLWKRTADKLRSKFEGLVFKTARKSYVTLMEELNYDDKMIKVQVGQSNDMLLGKSYKNYRSPALIKQVNEIHLKVLEKFKVEELRVLLSNKLKSIIEAKKFPKWLMGHSGVHKIGREYKILVGIGKKGNPVYEKIDPKYREYFMADETKSADFYNDINDGIEMFSGETTMQRVFKNLKDHKVYKELKEKHEENKALEELLSKDDISIK